MRTLLFLSWRGFEIVLLLAATTISLIWLEPQLAKEIWAAVDRALPSGLVSLAHLLHALTVSLVLAGLVLALCRWEQGGWIARVIRAKMRFWVVWPAFLTVFVLLLLLSEAGWLPEGWHASDRLLSAGWGIAVFSISLAYMPALVSAVWARVGHDGEWPAALVRMGGRWIGWMLLPLIAVEYVLGRPGMTRFLMESVHAGDLAALVAGGGLIALAILTVSALVEALSLQIDGRG